MAVGWGGEKNSVGRRWECGRAESCLCGVIFLRPTGAVATAVRWCADGTDVESVGQILCASGH